MGRRKKHDILFMFEASAFLDIEEVARFAECSGTEVRLLLVRCGCCGQYGLLMHHTLTKAAITSWKVCMVAPCSVQNTQLSITALTQGFGVPYWSTLRTSHQI